MRQLFLCLLLMMTLPQQAAVVEVRLAHDVLHFADRPRLYQLLSPLAQDQSIYWPAASLFRLEPALLQQQQQVLQDLRQLENWYLERAQLQLAEEVRWLHQDVQDWQLARRIPLRIEPDLARWQLPFNPRLDEGRYVLSYGERPAYLYSSGLYHQTALPYQAGAPLSRYLAVEQFGRLADSSHVWLIRADGEMQQIGIRAWNYQSVQPMPGSTVLVLFQQNRLPRHFRHLNERLFELAKHRIPPQ